MIFKPADVVKSYIYPYYSSFERNLEIERISVMRGFILVLVKVMLSPLKEFGHPLDYAISNFFPDFEILILGL